MVDESGTEQRDAMSEPSESLISIVIANYNGESYLSECLDALAGQSYGNIEIIVVDNASQDGSTTLIEQRYPHVRLVRRDGNDGFAAAVNAGIRAGRGEFVVILNNDTRVEPDFIAELYSALSEEPNASMAAPKMLFARGHDTINSMGLGYSITGTNHDVGFGLKDGPQFGERKWVFGPCGGAGMYRRNVFEDAGLFDEDFFMYYEDVDHGFRAQLAGHRCIFVPTARVYHTEGGSGGSLPKPKDYYFARNAFAVIVKNYPARVMLKHLHVIVWEMAKRAGSPLMKGSASALLGYLAGLGRIGATLKKRRDVVRHKRVPDDYIEDILKRNRSVLKEINLQGRPVEEH
jgi:GT2 family glycosyltransferase